MSKYEVKKYHHNDNLKTWVEALRSGDYKQGRQSLRQWDNYCCLGVACDLVDSDGWDTSQVEVGMYFYGDNFAYMPENILADYYGLTDSEQRDLGMLNDNGFDFDEIADQIEDRYIL